MDDEAVSTARVGHVATIELHRPPLNLLDEATLTTVADRLEELDADGDCRAVVLCTTTDNFCAGVDLAVGKGSASPTSPGGGLYAQAVRIARGGIPIVAALHGAAIGAGLGLACVADFRIADPSTVLSANFGRLGLHHGFGLTVTLPGLVGSQRAAELLFTGERVRADAALAMGLCDRIADDSRAEALALAEKIAASAPLAVRAMRASLRGDLADRFAAAVEHEEHQQVLLRGTEDFREGMRAFRDRRPPEFVGR